MRLKLKFMQFSIRTLLIFVCVAASLFGWIHHRSECWQREVRKLEGKWEAVEWNFGDRAPFFLAFNSGTYVWTTPSAGNTTISEYAMPVLAQPKEIDIISWKFGGVRLKGLYRIEGDTLTIMHGSTKRPSGFDDLDGAKLRMVFRNVPGT